LLGAAAAALRGLGAVAAVEQAARVEAAMQELRVRGPTSTPRLDGRTAQELRPLVAALVRAAPPATAVVGRVLGRWQRIGAALDAKAVADVADAEGRRQWERLPTEAMVAVQEYMKSDKLKEYMKSCGLEAWHSHFVKHTCVAHGTLPPKRTLPSRCHPGHASAAIACV
jgi:hypothetical protein